MVISLHTSKPNQIANATFNASRIYGTRQYHPSGSGLLTHDFGSHWIQKLTSGQHGCGLGPVLLANRSAAACVTEPLPSMALTLCAATLAKGRADTMTYATKSFRSPRWPTPLLSAKFWDCWILRRAFARLTYSPLQF